ncbi:N-acyl homoserine lactonase [Ktedonobacter sp. SOSP1-52]|uniref:N-acyl homoserine lactonase family protein n=1 Tax=Ktedonobacter sp. SOSP1-52 TaxID=2778366 RepID=UPI001A25CDF9|nr:N-acyl homoserine lactonase family protein [Ktedonobacter sp. SOSP1-52]GHO70413.1 N-acyl homoserine lactonase [Ktedonobacter sp. SOSP1-52]
MKLYCMKLGWIVPFHLPITGYLVQTDDGLNILVDTGISRHFIETHSFHGQPFARMGEAEDVVNQLARVGLAPHDIHLLISSHFDPDHAGNLTAFSRAHIVVQRRQYLVAKEGTIVRQEALRSQWDAPELRYQLVDGDTTLLPGIELIETSGHSPGHQSVLVRLPQKGPVLLAIDAIPSAGCLDPDTRPLTPFDMDEEEVRASTRKLIALAERERVTLIVHGHDREQWQQLKLLPECYT